MADSYPALPARALLENQARWLAPARAALLRRAGIAHRQPTLDLGAAIGLVTPELIQRSKGSVYAVDVMQKSLCEISTDADLFRVAGDARCLPFMSESFQLVFCQLTLLWVFDLQAAISEIWRLLEPGGQFCAIEPDYGGLIEFPPSVALADVWREALKRAGAVHDVGRRLPGMLEQRGFSISVRMLDQMLPPSPLRFDMLQELPLDEAEKQLVREAEKQSSQLQGWQQISHLPLFLINATRPY